MAENKDMLAIPMAQVMELIDKLQQQEANFDHYVLVVPKDPNNKQFYIMEKKALFNS